MNNPSIDTIYVRVAQIESPFRNLYAKPLDVKLGWVKYALAGEDKVFHGMTDAQTIESFHRDWTTEDRANAVAYERGIGKRISTGFNCCGERMGAQR